MLSLAHSCARNLDLCWFANATTDGVSDFLLCPALVVRGWGGGPKGLGVDFLVWVLIWGVLGRGGGDEGVWLVPAEGGGDFFSFGLCLVSLGFSWVKG